MSGSLFITATEARSGKSLISLGVMEMLHRKIDRVGFFRPLINGDPETKERDNDIELISTRFNLGIPYEKMYAYTTSEANRLISIGREADLIGGVIKKYNELRKDCDFILCEGTDFAGSTAAFEFDINAEISKNLACPVLLVANAH
ncbi:MAG: AAA family ATPase, partial [Deltaproteobacteria bacterium]|nr:AAA family ATPase [Deltaproteobacteria bacterium]